MSLSDQYALLIVSDAMLAESGFFFITLVCKCYAQHCDGYNFCWFCNFKKAFARLITTINSKKYSWLESLFVWATWLLLLLYYTCFLKITHNLLFILNIKHGAMAKRIVEKKEYGRATRKKCLPYPTVNLAVLPHPDWTKEICSISVLDFQVQELWVWIKRTSKCECCLSALGCTYCLPQVYLTGSWFFACVENCFHSLIPYLHQGTCLHGPSSPLHLLHSLHANLDFHICLEL